MDLWLIFKYWIFISTFRNKNITWNGIYWKLCKMHPKLKIRNTKNRKCMKIVKETCKMHKVKDGKWNGWNK